MYRLLAILMLLSLPQHLITASSNRATKVLDKIVIQLEKGKGISALFTVKQGENAPIVGCMEMQGRRFVWQLSEMTTWFDGTTQWTLLHSSQEVNISQPEDEEVAQTNPCLLLSAYKNDFTEKFEGQNGNICQIVLTPQNHSEIKQIRLFIDELNEKLQRIIVEQTDGEPIDITISQYRTGQNFPESHFVFPAEKYPQVEIIDLR